MKGRYVKLGDVCSKASSNIAQKDLLGKNGNYPIYGASGYITNVDFYQQEESYIAIVKDGAGVGRTMLLPPRSSVIGTLQYIIPDRNQIDIEYLFYAITYMDLARYYSGATIPHIYFKDYKNEIFYLPEKDQQQKVTAILRNIDNLIDTREKQLNIYDDLLKSRFIEMFGDISINDKGWDARPLGSLCTIVRGSSPRPIEKYLGGSVPWIKIGDATEGDSIYLYSTKEHIIDAGISKSRMVKAGSLIFANCGVSLGFARIVTFDGCIHDGWLALEDIDEHLEKVFVLQSLNQMTEHFRKIAPAGTQPNLNTAIMKAHKQILPPLRYQREFISFVQQTDKSKYFVEKSLKTYISTLYIVMHSQNAHPLKRGAPLDQL